MKVGKGSIEGGFQTPSCICVISMVKKGGRYGKVGA